jgi:integrase
VRVYAHRCGQWVRKIPNGRGGQRTLYLGPWADPDGALALWRRVERALVDGRPVDAVLGRGASAGGLDRSGVLASDSLDDAVLAWLDWQHDRARAGVVGFDTYGACCTIGRWLLSELDGRMRLDHLGVADFDHLARRMAHLKPTTRGQRVAVVRALFNWLHRQHQVDPPPFGLFFAKPSTRERRRHDRKTKAAPYTAPELRRLIAAAPPWLRACVMLAANAGFGPSDLADLDVRDLVVVLERRTVVGPDGRERVVRVRRGRLDTRRAKTEAIRRVPLWPETLAAIEQARVGPRRLDEPDAPLLASRSGTRLGGIGKGERYRRTLVTQGFTALRRRLDMRGHFYLIRATFDTQAFRVPDDTARRIIMGHVIDRMDETYVRRYPWERLDAVAEHVRRWLFAVPHDQGAVPLAPEHADAPTEVWGAYSGVALLSPGDQAGQGWAPWRGA